MPPSARSPRTTSSRPGTAAAALLPAPGRRQGGGGDQRRLLVHPRRLAAARRVTPSWRGFWSAEAVWITHSAGVAEAVAEWMVDRAPAVGGEPIDLSAAHLDRFDAAQLAPAYVRASGLPQPSTRSTTSSIRWTRPRSRGLRASALPLPPGRAGCGVRRGTAAGSDRCGTRRTPACPRSARSPRATTGPRGTGRRSPGPRPPSPGARPGCSTSTPLRRVEVTGPTLSVPAAPDHQQRSTARSARWSTR